jgi:hypothetical protein
MTGSKLALYDHSAFHHELNVLEFAHVGDRVSRNGDDIGVFPSFDRSYLVRPSHQFSRVGRGGADRFNGRQSKFRHGDNFTCVLPMRLGTRRIEPVGDFHAQLSGD